MPYQIHLNGFLLNGQIIRAEFQKILQFCRQMMQQDIENKIQKQYDQILDKFASYNNILGFRVFNSNQYREQENLLKELNDYKYPDLIKDYHEVVTNVMTIYDQDSTYESMEGPISIYNLRNKIIEFGVQIENQKRDLSLVNHRLKMWLESKIFTIKKKWIEMKEKIYNISFNFVAQFQADAALKYINDIELELNEMTKDYREIQAQQDQLGFAKGEEPFPSNAFMQILPLKQLWQMIQDFHQNQTMHNLIIPILQINIKQYNAMLFSNFQTIKDLIQTFSRNDYLERFENLLNLLKTMYNNIQDLFDYKIIIQLLKERPLSEKDYNALSEIMNYKFTENINLKILQGLNVFSYYEDIRYLIQEQIVLEKEIIDQEEQSNDQSQTESSLDDEDEADEIIEQDEIDQIIINKQINKQKQQQKLQDEQQDFIIQQQIKEDLRYL